MLRHLPLFSGNLRTDCNGMTSLNCGSRQRQHLLYSYRGCSRGTELFKTEMVIMAFNRAVPMRGMSLARWQYLRDQEELNSYYWAARFSGDIANRQAKRFANADAASLLDALNTSSRARNSMGHSHDEIIKRLNISDRWLRLSTLVLASSAFERYLKTIATTAAESDPLLTPGWPKRIDGLTLTKYGIQAPPRSVEGTTKGEWTQRASVYKSLFGALPATLAGSLSELDAVRKLRNLVAHEFGAYADSTPSSSALLLSIGRRHSNPKNASVSHERLIKWLGIFNSVARAIDEHLTGDYIGDYEMAAIFLEWKTDPDRFEGRLNVNLKPHKRSANGRFSSAIGAFVPPFGRNYEAALGKYIESL